MTEPLEAARRIVAAADHYLASVREHGHKSATAEQALDCYTAAIEKDADVVARALLAREQAAGWQPIETAPRGEQIMLADKQGLVFAGFISRNDPPVVRIDPVWHRLADFTHWRHYPAPPGQEQP